ncbi:polysaccharide deacetylase family protein [Alicyclobacillus dauci]|uniref:Polysaccharide deacetylase family protein n=1 Tax=Alicyclobacillus dauci TaxID=1475485 RepID=A0ABY6Z1S8_9BACL|nr:polysaccharide deacetylase family protein [Alicyclobacillus dauci]WAH36700.1 polysaccharide deacetylase family protein [Alicyclobacillus dauci]
MTSIVGCGSMTAAKPQSVISTTPTHTTSVTPSNESQGNVSNGTATTNSSTSTENSAANNSSSNSTNTATVTVDSPPAQDGAAWTDPTNLPGISHWDMANYHQISTNRIAPEIYSVPAGEVALTIDDGPSPYTRQIIDVLNKYHAHATFFDIGNNVKAYPDAVKYAVESGNLVEDHTMSHPSLFNVSPLQQLSEIDDDAHLIEQLTGHPVRLFRPPYENFNNVTEQILKRDGMTLALWNRDPRDWAAKSPSEIVHGVLGNQPSGGVFDLHDKQMTLQALPQILQGLAAMHLKMVVLPTPALATGNTGSTASAGKSTGAGGGAATRTPSTNSTSSNSTGGKSTSNKGNGNTSNGTVPANTGNRTGSSNSTSTSNGVIEGHTNDTGNSASRSDTSGSGTSTNGNSTGQTPTSSGQNSTTNDTGNVTH